MVTISRTEPLTMKGLIKEAKKDVSSMGVTATEVHEARGEVLEGKSILGFESVSHPITGEVLSFASKGAYIDFLATQWGEVLTEENKVKENKKLVRDRIDYVAEQPQKTRGALKLKGILTEITLTRVEKSNYTSVPRGQPSILQTAYEQIPEIRECVSVRFEEKLAAMDKLLASVVEQDTDDAQTLELQGVLAIIKSNRTVSPATPTVKTKVV